MYKQRLVSEVLGKHVRCEHGEHECTTRWIIYANLSRAGPLLVDDVVCVLSFTVNSSTCISNYHVKPVVSIKIISNTIAHSLWSLFNYSPLHKNLDTSVN